MSFLTSFRAQSTALAILIHVSRSQEVYYCTTMFTSTFSVYSAKKFPGMSSMSLKVRKDDC